MQSALMKKIQKLLIYPIALGCIASCSTKKNSVINRNFHQLTTKYNVLFNGQQSFDKGLKTIEDNYVDNFWKRLPIEPIKFDERSMGAIKFNSSPGDGFGGEEEESKQPQTPFDRAEEKSVKAIQKHSMNIKGYEKNGQIDNAYLLLGKSRYYTQRFIPAIEAFNYIIANYPKADLIYDTKVWRAKSNIRLENEKLAIESLNLLIELDKNEKNLTPVQRQTAYTAMAMAYEKTDTIQKVIDNLKTSITFVKNHQSARNAFILGQIYSELGRKDSARAVFKQLADTRRTPEKYRIHASIELVKNMQENDSSNVLLIDRVRKLIRNSDNRKYLNKLYYQAGVLQEDRGNTEKALDFYLKSLEAKNNTAYQKTFTYERIGNIYFNKQEYLMAGFFYDSVMQVTTDEFATEKRIRRIRRKNKGLTKLKSYEDIVKNNDSILRVIAMSPEERTTYFEEYIEQLKEEDERKRQLLLNAQNFGGQSGGFASVGNNQGKWYFYNFQSKGLGKANFQKVWGNRTLEDDWRWSEKKSFSEEEEETEEIEKINSRYELSTYLDAIPTDQEEIDAFTKERNDALYQLGLIYKEQFKNTDLAILNFERSMEVHKDTKLELPITYHLYQLYAEAGNTEQADAMKDKILNKFSDSKFAKIILSPDAKISSDDEISEIDKKYEFVYRLYKHGMYEDVVNQIDGMESEIEKSDLIAKFALVKALSIGKHKDRAAYKEALESVVYNYPDKIEGQKASEILELLKEQQEE